MKSATDTSSISFTAHYTGFVWFKNQLSAPAFTTPQGQLFYQLLRPFEFLARHVIGTDIRTTLLQRHYLLDRELATLIATHPRLQVLEIACGLSPRGYRFAARHPGIRYVEADLPAMVARKQALLSELGTSPDTHKVVVCNILEHGPDSLENVIRREFDTSLPLVVITEGLVNYFELDTISGFWRRLANSLRAFPVGCYLTDVYPSVRSHRFSRLIRASNESLRFASRSRFCLHFESDPEMTHHFDGLGFSKVRVFNPDADIRDPNIPSARGGSIVRVVRALA